MYVQNVVELAEKPKLAGEEQRREDDLPSLKIHDTQLRICQHCSHVLMRSFNFALLFSCVCVI